MSVTLTSPAKLFSADELIVMPETERYELIKGVLVDMTPPPGWPHGNASMSIPAFITVFVLQQGLGLCFAAETGFLVERDPDTVLAPDFAFVSKGRVPKRWGAGYMTIVPDLVLETRSPSSSKKEIADRIQTWLGLGAIVVIDMDPVNWSLRIFRQDGSEQLFAATDTLTIPDLLPGFELSLSSVRPVRH